MSWARDIRNPKNDGKAKNRGGGRPLPGNAPKGKPDPEAIERFARAMEEKYHLTRPEGAIRGQSPAKDGRGSAKSRPSGDSPRDSVGSPQESGDEGRAAPERTKPNRVEHEFMMDLMMLRNSLANRMEGARERMEQVNPQAWRDMRLLFSLVCRLQDQLMATMPAKRQEYYLAMCRSYHYELIGNGPIRNKRIIPITDSHLAAITEACMEHECGMCIRDGDEIRKCPIREALMEVAPPTRVADGDRWIQCEYRGAAGSLVLGEDISI